MPESETIKCRIVEFSSTASADTFKPTASDRYGCENGIAARYAGLLKLDLAWLECTIHDRGEFVLLVDVRSHHR